MRRPFPLLLTLVLAAGLATAAGTPSDLLGEWSLTVLNNGRERPATLIFERDGEAIGGVWRFQGKESKLEDVSYQDGALSFRFVHKARLNERKMAFSGTVDGGKLEGRLTIGVGFLRTWGEKKSGSD